MFACTHYIYCNCNWICTSGTCMNCKLTRDLCPCIFFLYSSSAKQTLVDAKIPKKHTLADTVSIVFVFFCFLEMPIANNRFPYTNSEKLIARYLPLKTRNLNSKHTNSKIKKIKCFWRVECELQQIHVHPSTPQWLVCNWKVNAIWHFKAVIKLVFQVIIECTSSLELWCRWHWLCQRACEFGLRVCQVINNIFMCTQTNKQTKCSS